MKRILDFVHCRVMPWVNFSAAHAVAWYLLALLHEALLRVLK